MIEVNKKTGYVYGIRFLIKTNHVIQVWKPIDLSFDDFKPRCNMVIKYLIDEGFYNKKQCRVEIVNG